MKYLAVIIFLLFALAGCSGLQQHEKIVQQQAQYAGLSEVAKSRFDVAFVDSSVALDQYKKIIIKELDLSQVTIIEPRSQGSFSQPWTLTEEDRRYYKTRFAEAAHENLLASGQFVPAATGAANTLVLSARISEIAPHASKDDAKGRPTMVNVYSEGFGRMTIVFELRDAATDKLVMVATDEHDLGNLWEQNNRVQNNLRIRLAFDYWLHSLAKELNAVAKH